MDLEFNEIYSNIKYINFGQDQNYFCPLNIDLRGFTKEYTYNKLENELIKLFPDLHLESINVSKKNAGYSFDCSFILRTIDKEKITNAMKIIDDLKIKRHNKK